jgi:hypothetical protein
MAPPETDLSLLIISNCPLTKAFRELSTSTGHVFFAAMRFQ